MGGGASDDQVGFGLKSVMPEILEDDEYPSTGGQLMTLHNQSDKRSKGSAARRGVLLANLRNSDSFDGHD